jgi:hypothetical protein
MTPVPESKNTQTPSASGSTGKKDNLEAKISQIMTPAKDEEGVTSVGVPKQGKPRQKKIAVLTSGGDSAGMNAAGEYAVLSWMVW